MFSGGFSTAMGVKGLQKKSTQKTKKQVLKFHLDCKQPVDDSILNPDDKTGNLGKRGSLSREEAKIRITAEALCSKRYLKYLTKKYLKKQQLRDFLHVIAFNKTTLLYP